MADDLFENLGVQGLTFIIGESAEDVLKQVSAIRLPVKIISIYAQGSKHYAWIQTSAKIIRSKKGV